MKVINDCGLRLMALAEGGFRPSTVHSSQVVRTLPVLPFDLVSVLPLESR